MTFVFALLAGILSTLSPCVLPLLPFVLAGATRAGVMWLAFGLALSFAVMGLFIATIGFSIGLDGDIFKRIAAIVLFIFGLLLLIENAAFSRLLSPLLSRFEQVFVAQKRGQFLTGLGLGLIWSPCVGPTLGAASLLASKGENLPQVFLSMFMFGLGAALPIIGLGFVSRARLQFIATWGKKTMGVMLIALALIFFFGLDKWLESRLLEIYPPWLTNLTTRF